MHTLHHKNVNEKKTLNPRNLIGHGGVPKIKHTEVKAGGSKIPGQPGLHGEILYEQTSKQKLGNYFLSTSEHWFWAGTRYQGSKWRVPLSWSFKSHCVYLYLLTPPVDIHPSSSTSSPSKEFKPLTVSDSVSQGVAVPVPEIPLHFYHCSRLLIKQSPDHLQQLKSTDDSSYVLGKAFPCSLEVTNQRSFPFMRKE